eukprot:13669469-Ditylum_brightwellii.AAC.1
MSSILDTTAGDAELPNLIPRDPTSQYDLLIPSQTLPKKQTAAQRKINNGKHHGHRMTPKEKNTLRIYFQNINGIST